MTEEQIQAYVLGELPPEEAAKVAAAVARDPKLADMVKIYQQIQEGFRQQRVKELQQELMAYDKTLLPPTSTAPAPAPTSLLPEDQPTAEEAEPKVPRSWIKKWWPLLVIGILTTLLAVYFIIQPGKPSLSEQFYQAPPEPAVAGAENSSFLYQSAVNQFFDEEYTAAKASFAQLLQEDTAYTSTALFYLPHTSFKLNDYDTAAEQYATALADEGQPANRRTLLRWNAMINRLASDEDIAEVLAEEWPANYPATALRKALDERR